VSDIKTITIKEPGILTFLSQKFGQKFLCTHFPPKSHLRHTKSFQPRSLGELCPHFIAYIKHSALFIWTPSALYAHLRMKAANTFSFTAASFFALENNSLRTLFRLSAAYRTCYRPRTTSSPSRTHPQSHHHSVCSKPFGCSTARFLSGLATTPLFLRSRALKVGKLLHSIPRAKCS
jgi:hypothetical protein